MTEQYNPTTWVNGETSINDIKLNKIEIGITNNSNNISSMMGDMKFKGTVTSVPGSPVTGDVYQAGVANLIEYNKIGDLIVCVDDSTNPVTWHVIPSGPRGTGTVTSIQAGDGISIAGGAISGSGTVNIDPTYTAIETDALGARNGLMTSAQAYKVNHLAQVALSASYSDLDPSTIPASAKRAIEQNTGNDAQAVMSQAAITEALGTKSDVGHHHQVNDIDDLDDLLAIDDGVNVRAAADTHEHGLISRDGHFWKSDKSGYVGVEYLHTNANGVIISSNNIPSTVISGTSFSNGLYRLDTMKSDITDIQSILTPTGESELMTKAATEDHVHDVFSSESNGFVPKCTEENPEFKTLAGNGQWVDTANLQNLKSFIDIIYPIGCYFETSDAEFDPNVAWPDTYWILESEGLVHVSGSKEGTYKVGAVGADKGANNKATETVNAYAGIQDGGEAEHKLTSAEAAQKSVTGTALSNGDHYHSMNNIWSDGSGGNNAYKYDSKRKLMTRYTASAGAHTHSVSISPSDATNAHNNMQPYINIYRWHRIIAPPTPVDNNPVVPDNPVVDDNTDDDVE